MHIIPVIDLLDGHVVHARQGARGTYLPIQSKLSHSSEPLAIVESLLTIYPFKTIYIADLNAIQNQGSHMEVITKIVHRYPSIEIWLDAGINNTAQLAKWPHERLKMVLGSESFVTIQDYLILKHQLKHFILSLDFFTQGFAGPPELLENPSYWPSTVIAMTLEHVGSNLGIAQATLEQVSMLKPRQLYAAGGVRNAQDLEKLRTMGVDGALVASALHSGQISRTDLDNFRQ